MSDKQRLPSDIGGDEAGPIDTIDHGMKHWERQANALRTLMIEKGYMTEAELKTKMDEVRARFNVPDEMESPIKKAAKR